MDIDGLLELMRVSAAIAFDAVLDGYEIIRPSLHSAAQSLADFLAK
ncbi:hypothetical protein ACWIDW_04970 [Microbacterium sp. NPDC055312]